MFQYLHDENNRDITNKINMKDEMFNENEEGKLVLSLHDKAYRHNIASEKITILESWELTRDKFYVSGITFKDNKVLFEEYQIDLTPTSVGL